MAWYTSTYAELGYAYRDYYENPSYPYEWKEFCLWFDVEWVSGAGYLDWKMNDG